MIIDCHTHTFISDGELLASELIRRCEYNGYNVLAITDHADAGNIPHILSQIIPAIETASKHLDMIILPGVEITHVHPAGIADCVKQARDHGAKVVVVHGQTPVECVMDGTNEAAIKAGCDILAHPGRIHADLAKMAADNNVMLEISFRRGSSLSNGYIFNTAKSAGAKIIVNSDAHSPSDIFTEELYQETALGAGMTISDFKEMTTRLFSWAKERSK